MKPSFALNLSPDGISLLRRVAGGWRTVDEVSLDDAELPDKLKIMRQTAASLENGSMSTKLVIPNSQILYTTVSAPGPSDAERVEQIRSQLEGMTPYSVDELAFDWEVHGDSCAVAAVAGETLREAEAFATENKFNPVSLVATPQNGAFKGEPFFGLTQSAASVLDGDETVERDTEAVVVLGMDSGVPFAPPIVEPAPAEVSEDASVEAPEETPAEAKADEGTDAPAPSDAKAKTDEVKPAPAFQTRRSPDEGDGGRREPLVSATPSRISFVPVDTPPARTTAPPVTAPLPPLPKRKKVAPIPPVATATPTTDPVAEPVAAPVASVSVEATPVAAVPKSRLSLLKRGKAKAKAPAPVADTALASEEEAAALTIFGARKAAQSRGKPRFLGLILTVLLLLFLAIVAFGSSYFLDGGIAGLFKKPEVLEEPVVATLSPEVTEALEDQESFTAASLTPEEGEPILRVPLAQPDTTISIAPQPLETAPEPRLPDLQSARSFYAATGIWQLPPGDFANPVTEEVLDDLYIASIDPTSLSHDAVALPGIDPIEDRVPGAFAPPPAFGTLFALDPDGFVVATPEGTMTPGGAFVIAGRPPVTPPEKPETPESALPEEVVVAEGPTVRPRARPDNLIETNERGRLGGLSLAELAKKRPLARPASPQVAPEVDEAPTAQAVASSRSPRLRPKNFAKIVASARARTPEPKAEAAVIAAQTITPKIPTRASVARRATVTNAINLKRVNLIGVYGTPSARRALVRLPSGRYVKVSVGDRVDGGKVSAISKSSLRYVKRGKNITLKMPSS